MAEESDNPLKMKEFSYYEFTGLLVPGGVFTAGILALFPKCAPFVATGGLGFGEFGLLLLVSYGLGHLLQGIGNLLETGWWWIFGRGMPSDWVRSGKRFLLTDSQREAVFAKVRGVLGLTLPDSVASLSKPEWHAIVRQIYAVVQKCSAAARVDAFTGNYGINRGLAAAFVSLAAISLLCASGHGWRLYAGLGVLTALAVARMHRFGVHYGRELFVQFLAAGEKGGKS
jgi:hypothetical protein